MTTENQTDLIIIGGIMISLHKKLLVIVYHSILRRRDVFALFKCFTKTMQARKVVVDICHDI